MIRYKIDVIAELKKIGFTTMTARDTNLFSQSTMKKFKDGDTSISLDNLNRLCAVLKMQPEDIIEYVEDSRSDMRYIAYLEKINHK